MKKSYWIILVVAVVIAAAFLVSQVKTLPSPSGGGGTMKTAEELKNLVIPKVGEEAPEKGVAVPGKIAEGESSKSGQQYWVFETELKEGKLNPFEFRLPINDILGISITNREDEKRTVQISSKSSFVPNFIEITIAPGRNDFMKTQVLEAGEYDVVCTDCKNQVIGKFVVVPKLSIK